MSEAQPKWTCEGCGHSPHGPVCLAGNGPVCRCDGQPRYDVVCQHGVASDVHCVGCHAGFFPDRASAPAPREAQPTPPAGGPKQESDFDVERVPFKDRVVMRYRCQSPDTCRWNKPATWCHECRAAIRAKVTPPAGDGRRADEREIVIALRLAAKAYLDYLHGGLPLGSDEFKAIKGRVVTLACKLLASAPAPDLAALARETWREALAAYESRCVHDDAWAIIEAALRKVARG